MYTYYRQIHTFSNLLKLSYWSIIFHVLTQYATHIDFFSHDDTGHNLIKPHYISTNNITDKNSSINTHNNTRTSHINTFVYGTANVPNKKPPHLKTGNKNIKDKNCANIILENVTPNKGKNNPSNKHETYKNCSLGKISKDHSVTCEASFEHTLIFYSRADT